MSILKCCTEAEEKEAPEIPLDFGAQEPFGDRNWFSTCCSGEAPVPDGLIRQIWGRPQICILTSYYR